MFQIKKQTKTQVQRVLKKVEKAQKQPIQASYQASDEPEAVPREITLKFKTVTNKEFTIDVMNNSTILSLKTLIEESQGMPKEIQRLVLRDPALNNDMDLSNDQKTVS